MEVQLLKNIITKLKTNEVIPALSRWSFLSGEDVMTLKSTWNIKQTKRVVSNNIAEFCMNKGGLRMEKVGDLDLIYTQMYSVKKTWSAYHLIERQGSALESQKKLVPDNVKRDLNKLLRLYFRACLLFVLGCKDSEELSLTGHHLESLAELAINKFSAGGYNKFQLANRPGGPAGAMRSRKRKVAEVEEHERVRCEYLVEKRQRLEGLDNAFGTTVLPTLEKVDYKVELPYKGQITLPELQNQEDLFHSRVQFRGKSVLEGIRNLAAAGYATMPLQKHLTCIPSRARNCFLLARKQQTSNETQQRKQNRSANQSVAGRVANRTATLPSPQRASNRTATLLSPQRASNRTAPLPSPKRASNRTARINTTEQPKVKETWKTVEKKKVATERQRLNRRTDIHKKVLSENQLLNRSVDSDTLLKLGGKKTRAGHRETSNVHQYTSNENLVPNHLKQKAKR